MHCRGALGDDFVLDNTGLTWRTKVYKVYREGVLFDMELARMPETQPFAASYMSAKRIHDEAVRQWTLLKNYKQTVDLKNAVATKNARAALFRQSSLKNLMYPAIHMYGRRNGAPIDVEALAATAFMAEPGTLVPGIDHAAAYAAAPGPSVRAFIMACPASECRGFLDDSYKCGMCALVTCKSCHELVSDAHVCNPDTVASVKALKAEARPCPTCAAVISKIDGCDQMWCTQCKTTFSWRTGQIETGNTHNPHFYAYMRANGGLARAPGDVPGGCHGFPPVARIVQLFNAETRTEMRRLMDGWDMWTWQRRYPGQVRTWNVVQPITPPPKTTNPLLELPDLAHYMIALTEQHQKLLHHRQARVFVEDNHDLRVRFMAKELAPAEFKVQLQRRDKAYRKSLAKFQVYDMVYQAGGDVFNTLIGGAVSLAACHDAYCQIVQLFIYANTCIERLEKAYTCVADKYSLEPYLWRRYYNGYM